MMSPMTNTTPNTTPTSARWLAFGLLVLVFAALAGVLWLVDLTPRVETDFFFSTDDPQLQSSLRIEAMFPSKPQVLIRATAAEPGEGTDGQDWMTADYVARVRELSTRLATVPGVEDVLSLTEGPTRPAAAATGPLWSRLLLANGLSASHVVLQVDDSDTPTLVRELETVLAQLEEPGFRLDMSGVPVVVELVRRQLQRDLRRFSLVALLVFGIAVALIFRSAWVVAGTLGSCLAACAAVLALLPVTGVTIGPLTANLATIVFVLTLSHIVFLTASWRRQSDVSAAVRETLPASFWCMVTTLLGFLSLQFADAKPMRELGTAGAQGALIALVVAFTIYPLFLRAAGTSVAASDGAAKHRATAAGRVPWQRLGPRAVLVLALLTALGAFGLGRVQTDPSLLAYFEAGSELRGGLEAVDEAGGSSPLELVVRLRDGGRLDTPQALERLQALQDELEADAAVGSVIGLPALVGQARKVPLMGFAPLPQLLNLLSTQLMDNVGAGFVTEDRQHARFFLRMREAQLLEVGAVDRREVVQRLTDAAADKELEVELVGGLYDLQGRLAELVARSLLTGLTALLVLFIGIAALVARHWRPALAMVGALIAVAVITVGSLGLLHLPLDVIASPAANIAIALGVDSMIHLVACWRRLRSSTEGAAEGASTADAWSQARQRMALPIAGAAAILAAGFGIFSLSSFPPTQNFGIAVVIGTLTAAVMALLAVPYLAGSDTEF